MQKRIIVTQDGLEQLKQTEETTDIMTRLYSTHQETELGQHLRMEVTAIH